MTWKTVLKSITVFRKLLVLVTLIVSVNVQIQGSLAHGSA